MKSVLLELYRHNTWATLRLLDYCQGLDAGTLDATVPGTYGTIREALRHLVSSEEHYIWTVTDEPIADQSSDDMASLIDLAERILRLGPRWELLTQDDELPNRDVVSRDGWRFPRAISMAQAIHHGNEHRSQVLSILGAHGLEGPDLSVWGYAEVTGLMRPASETAEAEA